MKVVELIEDLSQEQVSRIQPMMMRVRCDDGNVNKVQNKLRKMFDDKGKAYHEKVKDKLDVRRLP